MATRKGGCHNARVDANVSVGSSGSNADVAASDDKRSTASSYSSGRGRSCFRVGDGFRGGIDGGRGCRRGRGGGRSGGGGVRVGRVRSRFARVSTCGLGRGAGMSGRT